GDRATMTSSENETWEPQPPALLPPWHTPEREKLQEQARRFAMDEVLAVADADRRHELLARSARGDWIGAIALSEPDAGSDLAGVSTRAVLDGDEWVVTGHKRWCGNAKAADFIQVLVRERDPEPGESRSAGLVNLLLEKERGTFPDGLTGYPIDKVGYH